MSGSHLSLIVMPIVIALALAFWISLVYRASFHPQWKHHARPPRTDAAGGVFADAQAGDEVHAGEPAGTRAGAYASGTRPPQ
jgi:hypothetical protein